MSARDDGGPAFPMPVDGVPAVDTQGMTLRDYFAAKAMHGLLELCQHDAHHGKTYIEYIAGLSYGMADAMLKERQQ